MRTALLLPLFLAAGCAAPVDGPPLPSRAVPQRPASCTEVPPGALQALASKAAPGESLCLAPGVHPGPIEVPAGTTLWGPPDAVIRSMGEGTTVIVEGRGARLLGFTIDGSGGRFDTLDAALKLHRAQGVEVAGLEIRNAVFGILAERSEEIAIRGNVVRGAALEALGLRGDSIRLWETTKSTIEDNLVEHGRDVVVWYSSDNVVRRNHVSHGRYGTHLMYSHRNRVEDNVFAHNVVGVFVMYSRDVAIARNLLAGASGAAGVGLGVKESGNLVVTDNRFVANTVGVYLDTSPLQQEDQNLFRGNEFRFGDAGVVFHSSQRRNSFEDNRFRDNDDAVRVEGGGDALGIIWSGNDFDDYAGYDLDGDGFGDVPHEARSLSADLVSRHPQLEFFRGTAALTLVHLASHVIPLLEPRTLLRDPRPRFGALASEESRAN